MYNIIDIKTRYLVSSHATRKLANRKADRLNNEYGDCRYIVTFQQ